MQAFAFEPLDALEFVTGDGIILQEKELAGKLLNNFQMQRTRFFILVI